MCGVYICVHSSNICAVLNDLHCVGVILTLHAVGFN